MVSTNVTTTITQIQVRRNRSRQWGLAATQLQILDVQQMRSQKATSPGTAFPVVLFDYAGLACTSSIL